MKTLSIRNEYELNGETKVSWNEIGVLFEGKNGKTYVKLHHIPNTIIHVFEAKKKEAAPKSVSAAFHAAKAASNDGTPF